MAAPSPDPEPEYNKEDLPGVFRSVRWRVALCGFTCLFVAQTFRLSFTVGVSCMVDQSARHSLTGSENNLSEPLEYSPGLDRTWNSSWTGNQSARWNPAAGEAGPFDWNKSTVTTLLSAFFYGYIISQVPGGWLSRRYGTRGVIGIAMSVAIVCTAATPICARTHVYLLFAVRVALGLAQVFSWAIAQYYMSVALSDWLRETHLQNMDAPIEFVILIQKPNFNLDARTKQHIGMTMPALFNLAVRWVPPLEVTRFITIINAGFPIGQVVTFPISGLLCRYGFDDGWGSIFYVFALVSLAWLVAWFYTVYDTPLQHPRISKAEQQFIVAHVGRFEAKEEKSQRTPWCSIMTSLPVCGTAMGFFGVDWVNNTFALGLILYLKEVLNYEIASSGIVGALPFLVYFASSMMVGVLSDHILRKRYLRRVNTRRLFQLISFIPSGIFLAATGFVTKDNAAWAVACLILSQFFFGFSRGGFLVSVMDFAPRFAGEISACLNVVAQTTGLLVPLAIGNLTTNGTQGEWRVIFLIGGGIAVVGALGFCVFARGEVQPWAKCGQDRPEAEVMVEVQPPNRDDKQENC